MENKEKEIVKKTELKFTKEQILTSKAYFQKRDILNALLEEGKLYSKKEIDTIIIKFNKNEVR